MLSCVWRAGCPWDVAVVHTAATKHAVFVEWLKAEGWPLPVRAGACRAEADWAVFAAAVPMPHANPWYMAARVLWTFVMRTTTVVPPEGMADDAFLLSIHTIWCRR